MQNKLFNTKGFFILLAFVFLAFSPGISIGQDSCGECDGKVSTLTMQYNGDEAATIKVVQKKGDIVFEDIVSAGGEFTFSGADKKGTLGPEISFYVNGELNTKVHTSCSVPIGPGLVSGDFKVIDGDSRNGGLLCAVDPPPENDCGECDGKVTYLEMQYNGTVDEAIIRVEQKKEGDVFNGQVFPGGWFSFSGADKKGTLGPVISIYVNNVLNTTIHTSCSEPIGPGLVSGDFTVIDGDSRNGGVLCPLPGWDPGPQDCGDQISIQITPINQFMEIPEEPNLAIINHTQGTEVPTLVDIKITTTLSNGTVSIDRALNYPLALSKYVCSDDDPPICNWDWSLDSVVWNWTNGDPPPILFIKMKALDYPFEIKWPDDACPSDSVHSCSPFDVEFTVTADGATCKEFSPIKIRNLLE
jgi:hypothetical protein